MAAINTAEDLTAALEQLAGANIDGLFKQNGGESLRRRALTILRRLQHRVETPFEMSRRMAWQEPANVAAIRIALDFKLLEQLGKRGLREGVTISTLAKETSSPEQLVSRVLRHLAAIGVIEETGQDEYAANSTSNAFLDPTVHSGIDFWILLSSKSMSDLPKYLREGGWDDRETPGKGPWEKALSTEQNLFAWMNEHPEAQLAFANHMVGMSIDRVKWTEYYPVQERLLEGADPTGPLLVDVGGGVGHDTQTFQDQFPQPKGRLFVQDLPQVIAKAANDPEIDMQGHDFFTPQPVKGARAYFLHYILHDWSDDQCVQILTHLRDAMRKGYSKLLVHEFVVASRNADPYNTALDITMLAFVAGKERTEVGWTELFERAGLKVAGVFTLPGSHESVMEVILE